MSKHIADLITSALKDTAVLVTSMKYWENTCYVFRASDQVQIATITKEFDELFEATFYTVWAVGVLSGEVIVANTNDLVTAVKQSVNYPREAVQSRNWSKVSYKEETSDY